MSDLIYLVGVVLALPFLLMIVDELVAMYHICDTPKPKKDR